MTTTTTKAAAIAAPMPVPPKQKRGLFPILRSPGGDHSPSSSSPPPPVPILPSIVIHSSSTASVTTFTSVPIAPRGGRGRSLTSSNRQMPHPALRIVPVGAATLNNSSGGPGGCGAPASAVAEAGFIPIAHFPGPPPPAPARINTAPSATKSNQNHSHEYDEDDDGFTPVTPAYGLATRGAGRTATTATATSPRSPRSAGGGITGLSPRDALGISFGKILRMASFRSSSRQNQQQHGADSNNDYDEYEDVTPLTPGTARSTGLSEKSGSGQLSPSSAGGANNGGVKSGQKTVRQTLFGLIEGWWDLELLERGRSLRKAGR
ncbi:hypothetical protein MN608_04310 [Microdochium nivale]|nr:hypothetical protein MN608_04310 [Microdochium nivale]